MFLIGAMHVFSWLRIFGIIKEYGVHVCAGFTSETDADLHTKPLCLQRLDLVHLDETREVRRFGQSQLVFLKPLDKKNTLRYETDVSECHSWRLFPSNSNLLI